MMKRVLVAVALAYFGWLPLAAGQGTETFPAYVTSKSASGSPLTNQCVPIVNNGGTATTKLCSGYAVAFGAAASNATLTLGSTTLTLGGTTTSVSGLTLASPTVTGAFTATGLVTNADLVNAATTVNGQTCTLGSTCTVTAAASGITVGTSTISSGSTGNVLYNNGGVLGERSDVARTSVNNTWTKGQAVTPVALTDGGSIAVDASLSNTFTVTITGDTHSLANPTNVIAGQTFQFAILQDGTGHTGFSTGSNYKYVGAIGPVWSTGVSKKDILSCWADTTSTLNCAALIDVR